MLTHFRTPQLLQIPCEVGTELKSLELVKTVNWGADPIRMSVATSVVVEVHSWVAWVIKRESLLSWNSKIPSQPISLVTILAVVNR
jgi:hypothetical protein